MNDFYVFEVLEDYEDELLSFTKDNKFNKKQRFIGWENIKFNRAFKSNTKEMICIPLDKVRKLYKIKFESI